eukprot:5375882-Prymnesium_polylepis.1
MLGEVACTHLFHSGANEDVLPVLVELDHAAQQHVARAAGLLHELPEKTVSTFAAADRLQRTSATRYTA